MTRFSPTVDESGAAGALRQPGDDARLGGPEIGRFPEDPSDRPFTPISGEEEDGTVFLCPLCGARFGHAGLACGACPLNVGCEILKCPHCGYQFPRSSRLVDWVSGWVRRLRGGGP